MGINVENFCDCDHNDSKIESSFKSNHNYDKAICPFINYKYFNNDRKNKIKKESKLKNKSFNTNKKKQKFDLDNCEMHFEYQITKQNNREKESDKPIISNKIFFNLNPNQNQDIDKIILNDINIKNNNNDENNIENNNNNQNDNRIITIESENYKEKINPNNKNQNQNGIIEEKINTNTNKNLKTKDLTSYNTNISNVKTNIEKPKNIPKNGLNIQIWAKNYYYLGYYKDDMADGIGKLIIGNNKHFGEFKNDQENGFGIFYNNINETIYEGYWENGTQNEYGKEKWNDGSIFFGKYLKGGKNGIGTYLWKDGSRYEGEFLNNMFEGFGIYFYNKNKIYLGQWKNNKKNGYGEFIYDDKLYIGNYLDNKKDGFGISYWKKEDKLFIGFWKNNKKNGLGKIFHEKKIRFGVWNNNDKLDQEIEWLTNEEEALNHLKSNNLEEFEKMFKNNKEEIVNYLDKFYKNDFIIPCSTPKLLLCE